MSYKIKLKCGNLLQEQNATFIVNASNTKLILGSGVSMAFKHTCGYKLQKEMFTKLEEIGILYKGDVVVTSSAEATNFIYTLHAIIINYNEGLNSNNKLPTLQTIIFVLKNIESYIQWYSNKFTDNNIKIVLPLLGCGIGGLDKENVILIYKNFFKRDVIFNCEVVIYGYSKKDCELLENLDFH